MRLALLLLVLLAAGCATSQPPGGAAAVTVSGTVTYLPRIALPPDAVVTVRVLDVSLADAPSPTLAVSTTVTGGRQVPIPFSLDVERGQIEPRRRYAVRAEIRGADGALLWTTDTTVLVLTNGAPSSGVELRLVQVAASEPVGGAGALVGPTWRLARVEAAGGVTVALDAGAPYTLAFGDDGRYSGQIDCNRTGGTFEAATDGALRLGQSLSTLAACAPPSASGDVLRVLGGVDRYDVAGDRLTLSGDAGALVYEREGGMRPQEAGRDTAYTCPSPDGPFTFRVRTGPGEVAVWLPERFEGREGGTYRVLGQVAAASGTRYQDGPVTVWTRGQDEALIEVDGETFTSCRAEG